MKHFGDFILASGYGGPPSFNDADGGEPENPYEASGPDADEDPQQDWQLTLAVRDAIATGLKVRAGSELTPAVIQERAANMAIALREEFDVRARRGS